MIMESDPVSVHELVATPTNNTSSDTECYKPPSYGQWGGGSSGASNVSHTASRRFPLTSSVAKGSVENGSARVAVPEKLVEMPFGYYNSRGELTIPIEDLPPPSKYASFPTYHAGFYPGPSAGQQQQQPPSVTTQPLQPASNTPRSMHASHIPPPPSRAYQNPVEPSTRLCKTPNCNAVLPFAFYKGDVCPLCWAATERDRLSSSDTSSASHSQRPLVFSMPLSKPGGILNLIRTSASTSSTMLIPTPTPPVSARVGSESASEGAKTSNMPSTTNLPAVIRRKRPRSEAEEVRPPAPTPPTVVSIPPAPSTNSLYNATQTTLAGKNKSSIIAATSGAPYPHPPSHIVRLPPPPDRQGDANIPKDSHRPRAPPRPGSSSQPDGASFTTAAMREKVPRAVVTSNTINLPDATVLRLNMTENRRCIRSSCSNTIPSSSSPYTLRCPSCVRADWKARKLSIESAIRKEGKDGQRVVDSSSEYGDVASSVEEMVGGKYTSPQMHEPHVNIGGSSRSNPDNKPNLVLKFPVKLWRKAVASQFCSSDRCCRRLDGEDEELMCVRCRAREREKMKLMGVSCTTVWSMRGVSDVLDYENDVDTEGTGRDEDGDDEDGMEEFIRGARLCIVHWCPHIVPPKKEYKWDMCLGCRGYLAKLQRSKGRSQAEEGPRSRKPGIWKQWGGDVVFERSIKEEEQGRCSSFDCGMLVAGWKNEGEASKGTLSSLCAQCVRRKAREIRRVKKARENLAKATSEAGPTCEGDQVQTAERQQGPSRPPWASDTRAYQEYISLSTLKDHFKMQLHAFLHQQATSAFRGRHSEVVQIANHASSTSVDISKPITTVPRLRPPPSSQTRTLIQDAPAPALQTVVPTLSAFFTFTGQFSSVSSNRNLPYHSHLHKSSILSHMVYVRSELERALQLKLKPANPKEPLVTFDKGFVTKFSCVHSIPLRWFFSSGEMNPEDVLNGSELRRHQEDGETGDAGEGEIKIRKDIKGELDIIVVADYSHPVLPGQTTAVRFRMGVIDVS